MLMNIVAIPENTYARIAPRSGLALKNSIDTGKKRFNLSNIIKLCSTSYSTSVISSSPSLFKILPLNKK